MKKNKKITCLIDLTDIINFIIKSDKVNNNPTYNQSNDEQRIWGNISSFEKPKELEKNKWLYPTDELGIMEEGKVL